MFANLDVLLDVKLEDALKELPIPDEIKDGLILGEGKCGDLYHLCLSYERGEWSRWENTRKHSKFPKCNRAEIS